MMRFNRDEQLLMMLYCPGTSEGLIQELEAMQKQLVPSEKRLKRLSDGVLEKLQHMSDTEFDALDLYP